MSSLVLVTMLALATTPRFEEGAPVLRAAAFEGSLAACIGPTRTVWELAPAYEIPVRITPPQMRSAGLNVQSIDTLEVRALAAADGVAIRIAWRDETADFSPVVTGETGSYPDAVAVQFPAGASGRVLPALAMGSQERRVNTWRWAAGEKEAEETIAQGFGWLSALDEPTPVRAAEARVEGGWAVTLSRPYEVEPTVSFRPEAGGALEQAERIPIKPGARLPCAFAVWNGAFEDRGGHKAVSIWYYLQLPPPF
jgi:complex iron-sulfur molybdoenzyme family reductase subunit gamma